MLLLENFKRRRFNIPETSFPAIADAGDDAQISALDYSLLRKLWLLPFGARECCYLKTLNGAVSISQRSRFPPLPTPASTDRSQLWIIHCSGNFGFFLLAPRYVVS
ncbi:hypothetical protein V6N13_068692 [Hibiscus sabdariffa]|uniref:Uncharacterized protein n=1 Tax=Hibiscus sabdariffa TaxID=183260 RepID=A0ABR2QND4_9ROSI